MILIVLVLRTMEAFKVFDIIWIMTRGGPANATQTIAIYAYQTAYQRLRLRARRGARLPHRPGRSWSSRPSTSGSSPDGQGLGQ